nr:PDZ domain-containing protein [Williamsia sterculiae]
MPVLPAHRRIVTVAVSALLLVVLILVGAVVRVPYVALGPGPTVNTLADVGGREVVEVEGAPEKKTTGHLNLTTVSVADRMTLFEAMAAWFSGRQSLEPRETVFPPDKSDQQVEQQNAQEMGGSQDSATLAALSYLKKTVLTVDVDNGGPAKGALRSGDQVTSVDGTEVASPEALRDAVSDKKPGTPVRLDIVRDGQSSTATVTLGSRPGQTDKGYLGVTPRLRAAADAQKVTFNVGDIGGPSAGLMLSLAIVDKLVPQQLTGGKFIAGTGTIDESRQVGSIGGITHKTLAAREAGAGWFLVPAGNCAEAKSDAPGGLELLKVSSLDDAITTLGDLTAGKPAPHC